MRIDKSNIVTAVEPGFSVRGHFLVVRFAINFPDLGSRRAAMWTNLRWFGFLQGRWAGLMSGRSSVFLARRWTFSRWAGGEKLLRQRKGTAVFIFRWFSPPPLQRNWRR